RILRAESEERCVRVRAEPSVANDGAVVKVSGTLMDITERVEADRVGRAAEIRFETGFEQAAIGSAIADLTGVPIRVNPAMCRLLGRSANVLVGVRWVEFTHPDEVPLWQA